MRCKTIWSWLLLLPILSPSAPAVSQTSDPRAVAILQQSLVAAGGTRGLATIFDFTSTGSITYFWSQQVTGTATVRGRGPDQWRLDANLAQGTRSHAVSHGGGTLKEVSGTVYQLPLYNTINTGVLTFPYLSIAAALNDPLTVVSYVGLVTIGGRQANQVRVRLHFTNYVGGNISKLAITDYFVDTQTNLIVRTSDWIRPVETFNPTYPHDIELQNYLNMGGANFPTLVREKISGQVIWELHLNNVSFNTGLTDKNFVLP